MATTIDREDVTEANKEAVLNGRPGRLTDLIWLLLGPRPTPTPKHTFFAQTHCARSPVNKTWQAIRALVVA